MTKVLLLSAAILGGIIAPAALLAETPNRTTMSFEEFVLASGCMLVDKGGYQNIMSKDGGNCPIGVTLAFIGGSSRYDNGADGIRGTADDGGWRSDN